MDGASFGFPEDRRAESLTEALAGFVDRLTALTPLGAPVASQSLMAPYQLRADTHCVQAYNLYGVEYDERGTCFRWSGPSAPLRFTLSLSPSVDWQILLRFIATSDPRNPASMALFVDGSPVRLSRAEVSGMWLLTSEPIRVQPRRNNEIVYNVPHLVSPREKDALSDDGRRLGIAWFDLRLEPRGRI